MAMVVLGDDDCLAQTDLFVIKTKKLTLGRLLAADLVCPTSA